MGGLPKPSSPPMPPAKKTAPPTSNGADGGGFGAMARRLGGNPSPGAVLGSSPQGGKARLSPNNTKGAGTMLKAAGRKGKGPNTKSLSSLVTPPGGAN